MPTLNPQLAAFAPQLVIFDKDGTLVDFHALWGGWATELAQRLETVTGQPIANRLFRAMDFDPRTGQILSGGHLAVAPMADLRALTRNVLHTAGLSPQATEAAMAVAWHTPTPNALVRPLTDLSALFSTLQANQIKVAIATSDDRALTEATLAQLNIASLVDALLCADDGLPIKPAPDMILAICRRLNIPPAKTVMVGDNDVDLHMGRAAAVGLTIGVLSGLGQATNLAGDADILLPSVEELLVWN